MKNDYGQRETKEKLRELAVERDINFVVPVDKTRGRPPFVVRHADPNLIDRQPKSHQVLNDGLVINDFTLSRPDLSSSLNSLENDLQRSRSISPVVGRKVNLTRSRSPERSSFLTDDNENFLSDSSESFNKRLFCLEKMRVIVFFFSFLLFRHSFAILNTFSVKSNVTS